jgi:Nod factor-specific ABC transporter ATP-binding protein NodI
VHDLAVKCDGLEKRYGDVVAVAGVSLHVRRGECFGLLGPNGAGKTTTIEILEGLLMPDAGEVEVLGLRWRTDERAIRERLGIHLQETQLSEKLTVEEMLRLFRSFYRRGRPIGELLQIVELESKRGSRVGALSGGQKQRLSLACALAGNPDLLFLDEPTTGLDPQARLLVWDRLRELTEEGKTLILTTHYMEEAARLCDRLVIMEGGLIIAEGTPGALVEEHVSPQVLEFRTDHRSLEELVPILEAASDAVERTGDESILAYTEDADALLERVRGSGAEIENTVYRQAGLEDVFLRLTGRRLVE